MNKPRTLDCAKYCEEYPCNRTECQRVKGFKPNVPGIIMLSEKESLYETNRIHKLIHGEERECRINEFFFNRRRPISN